MELGIPHASEMGSLSLRLLCAQWRREGGGRDGGRKPEGAGLDLLHHARPDSARPVSTEWLAFLHPFLLLPPRSSSSYY